MSYVKERILGAVTVMSEADAQIFWNTIQNYFSNKHWDCIESVEPDEIDLQMLQDIESDSDCSEFISSKELKDAIGL